ncbi:Serine/threonine-protein kinase-like protein acr4, partial [Ancistrocladus abbreviatus]
MTPSPSLHQHLHGKNKALKEQLDWVRRATIAVQAARGIEYLHGYACPPVIHQDIKSSNILIDEEHNARVADFGLSLLGPADSGSPLAELPAGTLGYLDPEYYRLHYLTTKSDVYSFGVLLLEILSGRKAIDMQYKEGNIVEWAVPLIKSGDISAILDPVLNAPYDLEAPRRIANMACKCVRMRGKDRPSMDKVTTGRGSRGWGEEGQGVAGWGEARAGEGVIGVGRGWGRRGRGRGKGEREKEGESGREREEREER